MILTGSNLHDKNQTEAPTPKDYQVDGINHLLTQFKQEDCILEASSTGYGKMYVACFVAKAMGFKLAVVCPKTIITDWCRTAEAIGVETLFVTNYEKVRSKKFEHGRWKIYKKQYEWVTPDEKTLLVFDECHKMKTRRTIISKVGVAAVKSPAKKLLVSATIAENPLHMYVTGMMLGLHDGSGDYFHWCNRNGVKTGPFGFYYGGGLKGLVKLREQIFPSKGHRVLTSDIPGFPENQVEVMGVDITKSQSKKLEKVLQEIDDKRATDIEISIVDQLRARQETEAVKVNQISELAKMYSEDGNAVVIFMNFSASIDLLRDIFPNAGVLEGGQSDDFRRHTIDAFQNNEFDILICQLSVGGVGASFHDLKGKPRVSLVSPSYSAVDLIQCLGRIHRSGSLSPAIQRIIFANDSIEAKIRRKVQAKINAIDTLNDGDLSFFGNADA